MAFPSPMSRALASAPAPSAMAPAPAPAPAAPAPTSDAPDSGQSDTAIIMQAAAADPVIAAIARVLGIG